MGLGSGGSSSVLFIYCVLMRLVGRICPSTHCEQAQTRGYFDCLIAPCQRYSRTISYSFIGRVMCNFLHLLIETDPWKPAPVAAFGRSRYGPQTPGSVPNHAISDAQIFAVSADARASPGVWFCRRSRNLWRWALVASRDGRADEHARPTSFKPSAENLAGKVRIGAQQWFAERAVREPRN